MNKYKLFALTTSISSALENAFNTQVKPEFINITNIAMYIIAGVLLVILIVRGVFVWHNYRQGEGELKWGSLLAVFICLVIAASAPSWMWSVIGW